MALKSRWNNMSRLNRTRISVGVFFLVSIAVVAAIPAVLMSTNL